jgi:cytochrome b subunit of formate dehydrogenase
MAVDLTTTNVLLGILAAVSVLEVLAVILLCVGGIVLFRRMTKAIAEIEERRIAPIAAKAHDILDDVKSVTGLVNWFNRAADRFRGAA